MLLDLNPRLMPRGDVDVAHDRTAVGMLERLDAESESLALVATHLVILHVEPALEPIEYGRHAREYMRGRGVPLIRRAYKTRRSSHLLA